MMNAESHCLERYVRQYSYLARGMLHERIVRAIICIALCNLYSFHFIRHSHSEAPFNGWSINSSNGFSNKKTKLSVERNNHLTLNTTKHKTTRII